jgi:hypothetical protein
MFEFEGGVEGQVGERTLVVRVHLDFFSIHGVSPAGCSGASIKHAELKRAIRRRSGPARRGVIANFSAAEVPARMIHD